MGLSLPELATTLHGLLRCPSLLLFPDYLEYEMSMRAVLQHVWKSKAPDNAECDLIIMLSLQNYCTRALHNVQ